MIRCGFAVVQDYRTPDSQKQILYIPLFQMESAGPSGTLADQLFGRAVGSVVWPDRVVGMDLRCREQPAYHGRQR